jgi:hypothetical protein
MMGPRIGLASEGETTTSVMTTAYSPVTTRASLRKAFRMPALRSVRMIFSMIFDCLRCTVIHSR